MKKTGIAIVFAAFWISGVAHALTGKVPENLFNPSGSFDLYYQQPTAESMAQSETDWMKTDLNLTADQVTKVQAINLKYAQKQMDLFQGARGGGGDFQAMQKQMTDLNAQKRTELQPVLTADQLKKYDDVLIERQNNRGGRGGGF